MRRWGATIKAFILRLGIGGLVVGFLIGIGALAYFASVFPDWVGFGADSLPPGATATPVVMYELDKDLWDWLEQPDEASLGDESLYMRTESLRIHPWGSFHTHRHVLQ
jgi:hypothetical protein